MLEIKFFVSLKSESFLFWTRVHFMGRVKFSKIFSRVAHKRGGGGRSDRFTIFEGGGGGLGKEG